MAVESSDDRNGRRPPRAAGSSAPLRPTVRQSPRQLPHNLDAEASILGGIILRNELLVALGDLDIDDFYDHRHKVVFQAMRGLAAHERPIDVVTLEVEIEKTDKLEAIGGAAFLGELTLRVPIVDNVYAYAADVRRHARHRAAMLEMASMLERAHSWAHDPREMLLELHGQLGRHLEIDHERSGESTRVRWCAPLETFIGDEEPNDDDAEDWIVRDIVPRGEPLLWGGPMKAGKTWAALDLAIAIALGDTWLGFENTLGAPARTLGVFLEDSKRRVRKRVWELCRGRFTDRGMTTPNDPRLRENLRITRTPLRLPDAKDQRRFTAEIKAWGARFVVIDNLTRVIVGDPNKTSDAAAFTRAWCEICEETGASLLFLHHTRKPMGDKDVDPFETLRGSGDFGAAARNIIVASPIRQDDGPTLAEIRVRGNLDLRRDGFVLGFERDQLLGKWRARLVDKGEIGAVKDEVKKANKERRKDEKKREFQSELQQRRNTALAIIHKEGGCSQRRLASEFGLGSPNSMRPVFEGLERDGIVRRDKLRGYVLAGEVDAPRQEGLL